MKLTVSYSNVLQPTRIHMLCRGLVFTDLIHILWGYANCTREIRRLSGASEPTLNNMGMFVVNFDALEQEAIFEPKGDKLSSSAECRIRTQGLRHQIDQSHRYGRHQAACREPTGSYDKTTRTAICFENKTQYLFIRAPYTRLWYFGTSVTYPPWFRRVKLVVIPTRFI